MKGLLMALAFVAGPALACPADGSKDAERATDKAVASTAKPVAQTQTATKQKTASTKVAVKSAREANNKASPL